MSVADARITLLEGQLAEAQNALAESQIAVHLRDLHAERLEAELARVGRLVSDLRGARRGD